MGVNYKNIVFIPARGGSKSIPLKNIKTIYGQPLIYWALDAAVNSNLVDKVFVSTDSFEIEECVKKYDKKNKEKIEIVGRSKEVSSDTASTESVMLEFAQIHNFENIVLLQCTNPLVTTTDITNSILEFENYDSLLSTVIQKRFFWRRENNQVFPENYDINNRPRRQDWDGQLVENGALYIISKENLLKSKCRLYGKIGTYIMDAETYYEIDEEADWCIIEKLLERKVINDGEFKR